MAAEQQQQPQQQETPSARLSEPSVGALLKASRLRVGQDLHDIADVLRIRYVYMEAIEDGRYDALPGPTYASGFIRSYAEHLGLDSQEVVRRFKAEGTAGRETASLAFPEPIPETGIPGGAIILVGIVIAVVAYGVWYVNTGNHGFLVELVSPIPERLATLVEGEGKPPGKTVAPSAAGKPEMKPEPKPETTAEAKPDTKPDATPEPSAVAPAPASAPATADTVATAPAAEPPAGEPRPAATTTAAPAEPAASQAETPSATPSQAPPVETAAAIPAAAPVPETRETPVATPRPPEPAAAIEPVIAPGNVPVDMIPAPRPATPVTATAAATPAAPSEPAAAQPAPAPEPAITAAAPALTTAAIEPATTTPVPAGTEPTRILVRAKTNSWIQVRDENANEMLVTRLLRSGDSYAVPNRAGLRLATGNAGALEILVDGAPVPAIGDDGAVRRNVLLDAEKLKAGQAVAD